MRNTPRLARVIAVLCLALYGVSNFSSSQAQQAGQQALPTPTPINQSDDPVLKNFRWRSIGPASMGGRIDDIDAVERNPYVIYVGFATGGVWKTVNNGTTWEPIFDTYTTSSIGDLAVCQSDPNIIWVGTGEPNNRQSSSFGDGVYKSTDGGKTFTNVGLKETQTIARIVIDPKDANTVYVAALGHLFGPNKERGIYKTTDSGKTWTNVKIIDEDTGFTDIVIDPVDTKTLYAASYQRRRTSWGFNGGGPGSANWKTTDAGKSWTKLQGNGLPEGLLGRIGLDVARSNPNVVYAQIEVGASGGAGGGEQTGGGGGFGGGGGGGGQQAQSNQPPDPKRSGVWRSDDKGKTWRLMSNNNNRPMYYSQIRIDPKNDQIVYTMGAPFYKSTDGGKTFQVIQGVGHSDHHALWINPNNTNQLILGNDGGLNVSYDQAATWEFINTIAASQFYAVAADMRKPYYICGGLQDNGSWCGPSQTRAGGAGGGAGGGIVNADWHRIGGGDGFYVQIDPTDHTTVYVESQNGNVQRLDLKTGRSVLIRPRAAQRPRGPVAARGGEQGTGQPSQTAAPAGASGDSGEGQQPTQEQTMQMIQAAGGFGGANPLQSNIVPAPPAGEQYRYNWSTPIHLSPHNPRVVYVGANKLFKSLDCGDTWTASIDLTNQIDRRKLRIMGVDGDNPMTSKNDGVSNYGNITTVAESPELPGVLWVGTDDGAVQLSKDGAVTWTNVANNIKGVTGGYQVSRVEPSHFDAAACYVAIDNHRNDDLKPYLFVTRDYGATWTSITNNLPIGNVNVIREDAKNKNLLFVGTEFGVFVSMNGGAEWKKFMTGLPAVRVEDLLIHPRDNDLIAGTHGRGVWIIDDITSLQQLDEKTLAADMRLFDVRPGTQWLNDITLSRYASRDKQFRGENPQPGAAISYYLKSAPGGEIKITISDITGKVVRNLTGTKDVGLNRVMWNLRGDPPPRPPGMRPGPPGANPEVPPPAGQGQPGQPQAGQGQQGQQGPPQGGFGGGGGRGGRFALIGP
ncbi:MAG: WD40/YVTN/BNR-like repeat-containing protein, partial [Blastocatellia bacterium]